MMLTMTVIGADVDNGGDSDDSYGNDPTAFIFSLRKNGNLVQFADQKFKVKDASTASKFLNTN